MSVHSALYDQYQVALARLNGGEEKSYTVYLYKAGLDKILKKCGEETFETVVAAKNEDRSELVGEINDVLYHATVLICFLGVTLDSVMERVNVRCQTTGAEWDQLYQIAENRRATEDNESYTYYLFQNGLDKILKKVGEACSMLLIAAKGNDLSAVAEEFADLMYHLMVMMIARGIAPVDLEEELNHRSGKTGNLKTFRSTNLNS